MRECTEMLAHSKIKLWATVFINNKSSNKICDCLYHVVKSVESLSRNTRISASSSVNYGELTLNKEGPNNDRT